MDGELAEHVSSEAVDWYSMWKDGDVASLGERHSSDGGREAIQRTGTNLDG